MTSRFATSRSLQALVSKVGALQSSKIHRAQRMGQAAGMTKLTMLIQVRTRVVKLSFTAVQRLWKQPSQRNSQVVSACPSTVRPVTSCLGGVWHTPRQDGTRDHVTPGLGTRCEVTKGFRFAPVFELGPDGSAGYAVVSCSL